MSVVAVKVTDKKITIGADSILVSHGTTQEKDKFAKLNKVNDIIIGDVGDAQEGGLFLMFCRTRKPREASVEAIIEFMSEFQDWMKNKNLLLLRILKNGTYLNKRILTNDNRSGKENVSLAPCSKKARVLSMMYAH